MSLRQILSEIDQIAKDIGASKLYICGGTPRDKVVGNLAHVSDIDLTTGDETIQHIAKEVSVKFANRASLFKKMDDGHSKMVIDGISIDFSSNFIIPNIDFYLRKFAIKNATKLQKEMFSRDFTCNSLLLDFDLVTILDPTNNGIKDIGDKILKTCLDPSITLSVDNKRIVRAIYLSAKLGFKIDESVKKWIKENPELIMTPGSGYVSKKLGQALEYNSEVVVQLLDEFGMWKIIPIIDDLIPYITQDVGRV